MKKLLFVLLFSPLLSKAQMDTTILIRPHHSTFAAPAQYQDLKSLLTAGIVLDLGGIITCAIGIDKLNKDYDNALTGSSFVGADKTANIRSDKNYIYAGCAFVGVGIILNIIAVNHIGKIQLKNNGISIGL